MSRHAYASNPQTPTQSLIEGNAEQNVDDRDAASRSESQPVEELPRYGAESFSGQVPSDGYSAWPSLEYELNMLVTISGQAPSSPTHRASSSPDPYGAPQRQAPDRASDRPASATTPARKKSDSPLLLSSIPKRAVPFPHARELPPEEKEALGMPSQPTQRIFYRVLTMYQTEVFTPIAKKVGLSPDAVLRMTLHLRRQGVRRIAGETEKPFCGYSQADFLAPVDHVVAPMSHLWTLKEMGCLEALSMEFSHITCLRHRHHGMKLFHPYRRSGYDIAFRARKLRETPWVCDADYRRVAHEYHERRIDAAKAVARKMSMAEDKWQLFEDLLFDESLLRSYGCGYGTSSYWKPQHISQSRDIQDLLELIETHDNTDDLDCEFRAWDQIASKLYDEEQHHLLPVLKRYAVSPLPDQTHRSDYDAAQHLAFRRRMIDWIVETCQS